MPFVVLTTLFSLTVLPFGLQATELSEDRSPAQKEVVTVPAEPELLLGQEREEVLQAAAIALGNVETAKGRFFQTDANFNQTEGSFYLRRPGRVRFEYDAPSPYLIVADGATVAIEDRDLETQDRVPLRATPLSLILDNEIDFETEANILEVRRANGLVAIELEDSSGETEGQLVLVLDANDYSLLRWNAIDEAGGITSVQLAAIETGVRINPRLFRIEDPEEEEERD